MDLWTDRKIGTKLGTSFGVMIVIMGGLGVAGWRGSELIGTETQGVIAASEAERAFQRCRELEYALQFRGVTTDAEGGTSISQPFARALAEVLRLLSRIGPTGSEVESLHVIEGLVTAYGASFDVAASAHVQMDTELNAWRTLGGSYDAVFAEVRGKVVDTAIAAARRRSMIEFALWVDFRARLTDAVLEPLLLARVRGQHFAGSLVEQDWLAFTEQMEVLKTNLSDVTGLAPQAAVASGMERLAVYVADYQTVGSRYYEAVLERGRAAAAMKAAGAEVANQFRDLTRAYRRNLDLRISQTSLLVGGVALLGVLLAVLLAIVQTRGLTRPFRTVVADLGRIAAGDVSQDVSGGLVKRRDEMGTLAKALQQVIASLRQMLGDVMGGVQTMAASSTELSTISDQMAANARHTSTRASAVASSAEELGTNATSVAAGMEQATTNLSSVATATEQMSATIGEVAANSERARSISADATRQAQDVALLMKQLGDAAQEVGKVTATITNISSQTNLLALNATIEAARAGAAGRGFAVVATEIKELALQTATATKEIRRRILGIQTSTASAVGDVGRIATVIREVGDLIAAIATAIEEQSTVTRDMARSIAEASGGMREANERVAQTAGVAQGIAADISGVNTATAEITTGSEQVQGSSAELSHLAEQLKATVGRFTVQAAA